MIRIDIDGANSPTELDALAALIAVLGGRVGDSVRKLHDELHGDPVTPTVPVTPVPAVVGSAPEAPVAAPLDTTGEQLSSNGTGTAPPAPPSAPSQTLSFQRDSAGIPWDERIHSSSKETVSDGTWRKKRGVDKALIPVVEAELRGNALPVPEVPNAPAAPAVPTAPPAPDVTAVADAPVAPPAPPPAPTAPVAPPAPAAPAPAAPAADAAPVGPHSGRFASMADFVTYVSSHLVNGMGYSQLKEKAGEFGKADFQEITKDPSTWDGFCLAFGWVE